jgi:hypothetical protein
VTAKETIEKYGMDVWLASNKEPTKKLVKIVDVFLETENEIIYKIEESENVLLKTGLMRMTFSNPSNNFIKWEAQ